MEVFKSVEEATNWWIKRIQTPSVYYKGDATASGELESFIAYLVACYYRKKLTKEQIENFKLTLSNLVQKELEENGFCHFGVDDKPYGILEQARSSSKFNKILFPWATKMQVYKDEVFLMRAEGYERKLEEIYEENPKQKRIVKKFKR